MSIQIKCTTDIGKTQSISNSTWDGLKLIAPVASNNSPDGFKL